MLSIYGANLFISKNGLHAIHGELHKCTGRDCISNRLELDLMHRDELEECLKFICDNLFTNLEDAMIGLDKVHKDVALGGCDLANVGVGNVAEELKAFGEKGK